ncbi:MAG: IS21 family transposase [Clostridiales bacterium]|nr:IS21 family transposase [Clostridiales bacterium]
MIEMDIYKEIRHSYLRGESQRSIAARLGIARQTVAKYSKGETHPENRKQYERSGNVITLEVVEFIKACFRLDEQENLKKQQHTAKRIYDRLVDEKDFIGSESTIRKAVREIRREFSVPPESNVPLSYEPGEAIQIDWGEFTCYLDGVKTKIYLFCGRLCYSCDIFVQAFKSANQESFLEAQQLMFDYFAGIPERLIFDNAKVAVKEGFGSHAKPQKRYASFGAHYAVELTFCNPAKGNEKSLVENLVGYARRNFLVPAPKVSSIEVLNNRLWKDCLTYRAKHKVQKRSNSVSIMYEEELSLLKTIPTYQFDTSKTLIASVNDFSTIRFDKNQYSVPVKYLRKHVTVKGYGNHISILYKGSEIANYSRNYGSHQTQYKLEHYLDLLERKPRSIYNAKPVKENISKALLDWGRRLPGGNKEMVKLLRLCVDYGEERILTIKDKIPSHIVPTVDMIRSHLNEPTETRVVYLAQDEVPIEPVDLTKYDKKYGMVVQ